MAINDIPAIVSSAMNAAITRSNIISGFTSTGIWPLNQYMFGDTDFMPSEVTDRPAPEIEIDPGEGTSSQNPTSSIPCPSEDEAERDDLNKTLGSIRPYPKIPARKETRRGRKRCSTAILTEPEMMEKLASEQEESKRKKAAKEAKRGQKRGRPKKTNSKN